MRSTSVRAQNTQWSKIRTMFNAARGKSGVINFGIGEPDFDTPDVIREAAARAANDGYTRYTPNAGLPAVRSAVADKLLAENDIEADPETSVIITCGGMGALSLSLLATVNPEDEVLLPDPGWTNYEGQVALCGSRIRRVPLSRHNGFTLTAEAIRPCLTDRSTVLVLNTPANPTGAVIPRDELERIAILAEQHDLTIVSDEVYEYFVWDGASHHSIASFSQAANRTITVGSFSKSYAMTGWRVGYAAGPPELVSAMTKLQENIFSSAPSVSQMAALCALTDGRTFLDSMISAYAKRRELALDLMSRISGVRIIRPAGAFYIFADISDLADSCERFALDLLDAESLVVVPGTAFGPGGAGHVRISYATGAESIREGMKRLARFTERPA